MILSSALVPHSPVLIPGIGKDNREFLKKTLASYTELASDFYLRQIDTLVVISPHGKTVSGKISVNSAPLLTLNFREFSDYNTTGKYRGAISLSREIHDKLETDKSWNIGVDPQLDFGSGVPLYLLTEKLKNFQVLPIYCSDSDYREHFEFGQKLQKIFTDSRLRIAVIASGDLSQRLSKNSPAGYSSKGAKFDQKIIEIMREPHSAMENIQSLNPALVKDAEECGLRPIVMTLGILSGMNFSARQLSYDTKLGVGYLTISFEIE